MRSVILAVVALAAVGGGAGYYFDIHQGAQAFLSDTLQKGERAVSRLAAARKGTLARDDVRHMLLTSKDRRLRVYIALHEKEPETFERMLDVVVANQRNADADQIANAGRAFIMQVTERKAKFLADDDLIALFAHTRDMSLELAESNAPMCIAMATGKPFGNIVPFISQEAQDRETDITIKMIRADERELSFLTAAEVQGLNAQVALSLVKEHGEDDLKLLGFDNVPIGKEAASCRMFAAYLANILKLPRDGQVGLLRALIGKPDLLDEQPAAGAAAATP